MLGIRIVFQTCFCPFQICFTEWVDSCWAGDFYLKSCERIRVKPLIRISGSDTVDISFMRYDFGARDAFNRVCAFQINFPVRDRFLVHYIITLIVPILIPILIGGKRNRENISQLRSCSVTIFSFFIKTNRRSVPQTVSAAR